MMQLGPETQVRHIRRLLSHEHYVSGSERSNIALLELDQPAQCGYHVQLACVPSASLRVAELTDGYASGWRSATATGEFPERAAVPHTNWAMSCWGFTAVCSQLQDQRTFCRRPGGASSASSSATAAAGTRGPSTATACAPATRREASTPAR